jgi:hypothetical protein
MSKEDRIATRGSCGGTPSTSAWNKRMRIPDPQVRDAAEQYDNARQVLERQGPGTGVLLPLLNTATVAVELFLKSLACELVHEPVKGGPIGLSTVHADPEKKNHCLVELLDVIQEDVRENLENTFLNETGKALRGILTGCEGLFQHSRYPFESKARDVSEYSLSDLMMLAEFLRKAVANMEATDRIW